LAGLLYILAPAFLIYFLSESFLRQAAVASINPQTVNVSSIMSQLPANVRDSINKRIQIGYLKDAVAKAATDTDRIFALCNYAEAIENSKEKESLYSELIRKYSTSKEVSRAYIFFFMNPTASTKITIPELHKYISQFTQIDQFYMYSAALVKLRDLKTENSEQLEFLLPLLDINPEYRDFNRLYEYFSDLAVKAEKTDLYLKSKKLEEDSIKKPFMERIIEEKLKAEAKKIEEDSNKTQKQ
jgi:hypothetical protein